MGTIREEDAHDGVKKESKKRKNENSMTSKEEGEGLLMHDKDFGAGKGPDMKESRDGKSLDGKDLGKDHRRKRMKEKSKIRVDEGPSNVSETLREKIDVESNDKLLIDQQVGKREKIHVEEIKIMKDKEKNTFSDADEGITGDSKTVKEMEKQAREEGHVKKNKKKKKTDRKEADCVGEDGSVDLHQIVNDVIEKVEAVEDTREKKKKKKPDDDSGSTSLNNECLVKSPMDSTSGGEDTNGRRNKRKIKRSVTEEGTNICSPVTNERDGFVGVDYVENQIDNVAVKKKRKKKKKDALGDASLVEEYGNSTHVLSASNEENREGGGSRRKNKSTGSKDKLDGNIGASENGARDCADLVENQTGNLVIEKDKSMEVKKKKKAKKDDLEAGSLDNEFVEGGKKNRSRKRKEKSVHAGASGTNHTSEVAEPSGRSASIKKKKKVTFSDQNEYFTLPDNSSKGKKKLEHAGKGSKGQDDGLVRGKRFTEEEDELVQKAVLDYIEDHQLGENGLEMVLKCRKYPEVKDCWKEIAKALPYRPYMSVYYRAHILFERSKDRKWTEEELELLKKFHEKHGAHWKTLADELGKHRFHVKDAWRRIKLPNRKKGNWSQDEYQALFDLVNIDLSLKAFQEKKLKHGMLRDNISWEAISEKLATRSNSLCCMKWYRQLSSSMVSEGEWADTDDYRLLMSLTELDAACDVDVDWDNLLEHRPGDVCLKRWNQMVRHLGHHGIKPFSEQVEILSQRYCPEILEAREAYESKPAVD